MNESYPEDMSSFNSTDYSKKLHSLRSLIPHITGLTPDDEGFEAARKKVMRIIQKMQTLTGSTGTLQIPDDQVASWVAATKELYENHAGIEETLSSIFNYNQSRNGQSKRAYEQPDESELIKLKDMLMEKLRSSPASEQFRLTLDNLDAEDQFIDRIGDIHKLVVADIDLVDQLQNSFTKIRLLSQYQSILQETLSAWRSEVHLLKRLEHASQTILQEAISEFGGKKNNTDNNTT